MLKTLPKREFGAGVAEIVKMAVTFNRDFFEWLEQNDLTKDENMTNCNCNLFKQKQMLFHKMKKS